MGQQQLLLIVLGVIIVGIAVAVGITMFGAGAAQANFDAVMADCQKIASDAQGWYRKPVNMGGGGRSFTDMTLARLGFPDANENGEYEIDIAEDGESFEITGTGVEDADNDDNPVEIVLYVEADSIGLKSSEY